MGQKGRGDTVGEGDKEDNLKEMNETKGTKAKKVTKGTNGTKGEALSKTLFGVDTFFIAATLSLVDPLSKTFLGPLK